MIANWLLIAVLLVISNQARRPVAELPVTASGITGLGEEATQVFSSRELAQIGTGAIHPVQAINAAQVRLTGGEPAQPDGNDELTTVLGTQTEEVTTVLDEDAEVPPDTDATGPEDFHSEDPNEVPPDTDATQPFNPFAETDAEDDERFGRGTE